MLKRLILLALILVVSYSVFASLTLTKTTYGGDQVFDGYLSINDSSVRLDKLIKGDVEDCGSYPQRGIELYDFLVNASLYSGNKFEYSRVGSGHDSLDINFNVREKDYGFWLRPSDNIDDFNFSLSGDASPKIDIGIDGYDWKLFGDFLNWAERIESEDYESSYGSYIDDYNTGNIADPLTSRCSDFEIPVDDLETEFLVQINAVAKQVDSEGELKAKIGSRSCVFDGLVVDGGWTEISCNLSLSVDTDEDFIEKEVCIKSDGSNSAFRIPYVAESTNYYFISVNKAVYGGDFSGDDFNSDVLEAEVENYLDDNCDDYCVVPFRIEGELNSDLTFDPMIHFVGGSSSTNFYDISQDILEVNLTGKLLRLPFFDSLVTPSEPENNCELKIDFLGESYSSEFNVSEGPVAKAEVSSNYAVKGLPINFDGSSSSGNIVSWEWDFGDNSSGSGKNVSHSYLREGNFSVKLTVKDNNGVYDNDIVSVSVANMENVLENEFESVLGRVSDAKSNFNSYSGVLKEFSSGAGFKGVVDSSFIRVNNLSDEFDSLKSSDVSGKDTKYLNIYNELSGLKSETPHRVVRKGTKIYSGYKPSSPYDIPGFSKTLGISVDSLSKFRNDVYTFNQKEVDMDYGYYEIGVIYLSGSENYIYVSKNFSSSGNEVIEKVLDPKIFTLGCNYENVSHVIFCSGIGSDFNLRYSYVSNNITLSSSFVIPLSAYDGVEVVYRKDCSEEDCDYRYCGDSVCSVFSGIGVNEEDSSNSNYCPQDCGKNVPWGWYSLLFVILIIGVLWINFYRGPGNFFDVTNGISFRLFRKRLFLIQKDKVILESYVFRALKEGFSEGEIRKALERRGWRKKQLDFIFKEIRNKYVARGSR